MEYSKELHDFLVEDKLFTNLSESDVKSIFDIMRPEEFQSDDVIVAEGDAPDTIYIILEGNAAVLKSSHENENDFEHEIARLKSHDTIGEVALIDRQPRSATVRAIDKVSTICFLISDLLKLSKTEDSIVAKLKINFSQKLSDYLRNTNINTLSERKKHQGQIVQLTNFDIVTGLPNQHLFKETLDKKLKEKPKDFFALYQIEVVDYKEICDALGEEVGEQLLTAISDRLSSCLSDVDMLARVGFNQFMILSKNINDPQVVPVFAKRIIRLFSSPFSVGEDNVFTNVYVGIAQHPDDGKNSTLLIKHAGFSLDTANLDEPNSFSFYNSEMNDLVQKRRELINALYEAYETDQFELFYQSQTSLKTGDLIGAETLIRWFHPERGMISPAEFIPIVEQTGLIVKLGNWILKMACAQAKMWHESGFTNLRIAVNLSAIQFKHKDLIKTITDIVAESNITPAMIELEITEGVMMSDIDETVNKIQKLVDLGFQIAIDDFGTGYSSLSYLQRLPIHKLKIDQSFVRDLDENEDSKDIVRCIVSMAKGLRLEVIAEGIENEAQLAFLKSLGCDEGQGYLFSKPISADEFERTYLNNRTALNDK